MIAFHWVNEAIQKKIVARATPSEIVKEARKSGMSSLKQDAIEKVMAGVTSLDEVVKVQGVE